MSKTSDSSKLLFVLEKIEDLFSYKESAGSIEHLLNSKMGFDATTMCIMQIGETLNKLSTETQKKYSNLPVKESYLTRNYIAHDYEGINKQILEMIIREQLPLLQAEIQIILKDIKR